MMSNDKVTRACYGSRETYLRTGPGRLTERVVKGGGVKHVGGSRNKFPEMQHQVIL